MRILRRVMAIAVGLGFMAATVTVGTLLASAISGAPQSDNAAAPPGASTVILLLDLVVCAVGAVLGGWLAARIASFAPYGHASVMAAIIAVLSATVSVAPTPGEPGWYPSAVALTAVVGILLGGKLRAAAAAGERVIA